VRIPPRRRARSSSSSAFFMPEKKQRPEVVHRNNLYPVDNHLLISAPFPARHAPAVHPARHADCPAGCRLATLIHFPGGPAAPAPTSRADTLTLAHYPARPAAPRPLGRRVHPGSARNPASPPGKCAEPSESTREVRGIRRVHPGSASPARVGRGRARHARWVHSPARPAVPIPAKSAGPPGKCAESGGSIGEVDHRRTRADFPARPAHTGPLPGPTRRPEAPNSAGPPGKYAESGGSTREVRRIRRVHAGSASGSGGSIRDVDHRRTRADFPARRLRATTCAPMAAQGPRYDLRPYGRTGSATTCAHGRTASARQPARLWHHGLASAASRANWRLVEIVGQSDRIAAFTAIQAGCRSLVRRLVSDERAGHD
jgi:hypothetical protein